MNLNHSAPWPIPLTAKIYHDCRSGYHQVRYCWEKNGWQYEARWHEPLPTATLITYPSWQLMRHHSGKGFGPDAHHKQDQVLAKDHWVPVSQVRFAALQYNQGQATDAQLQLMIDTHVKDD